MHGHSSRERAQHLGGHGGEREQRCTLAGKESDGLSLTGLRADISLALRTTDRHRERERERKEREGFIHCTDIPAESAPNTSTDVRANGNREIHLEEK